MTNLFFVTATDTGCGKTYISTALLTLAAERKLSAIGLKPVASGCFNQHGKLYNSDALALQLAASIKLEYDAVNPLSFFPAIAPHIAAQEVGAEITTESLLKKTLTVLNQTSDVCIIEGFGGWHAPVNTRETMAEFAVKLNCKIILVVGMRLGCINHAILSERAIAASGGNCIGWIANVIDAQMERLDENIESLKSLLSSPLLGIVNYGEDATVALKNIKCF